jgi:uncharacterized radical SAM superfamily Fe-S cluster-containing enzyme
MKNEEDGKKTKKAQKQYGTKIKQHGNKAFPLSFEGISAKQNRENFGKMSWNLEVTLVLGLLTALVL